DVVGLAAQGPAPNSVRHRLRPPTQTTATVIEKLYPKTVGTVIIVHSYQLILSIVIIGPPARTAVSRIAIVVVTVDDAVHSSQLVLVIDCKGGGCSVIGPLAQVPSRVIQVTAILGVHCAVGPLQLADVVVAVGVVAAVGAREPGALVAG